MERGREGGTEGGREGKIPGRVREGCGAKGERDLRLGEGQQVCEGVCRLGNARDVMCLRHAFATDRVDWEKRELQYGRLNRWVWLCVCGCACALVCLCWCVCVCCKCVLVCVVRNNVKRL